MAEERKFVLELIKLLVPPEHYKIMSCCYTEDLKEYCLGTIETRVLAIDYLIGRLEHFDKVTETN